jgi:hypothetical protein
MPASLVLAAKDFRHEDKSFTLNNTLTTENPNITRDFKAISFYYNWCAL